MTQLAERGERASAEEGKGTRRCNATLATSPGQHDRTYTAMVWSRTNCRSSRTASDGSIAVRARLAAGAAALSEGDADADADAAGCDEAGSRGSLGSQQSTFEAPHAILHFEGHAL